MDLKGSQIRIGTTALVVDLAKASEKVQLSAVWKWATCDFLKGSSVCCVATSLMNEG